MLPIKSWPTAARTVARTYGARGLAYRAMHEARRATGAFRRTVRHRVGASDELRGRNPFAIDAARLARETDVREARRRGDRVVAGEHQAYRWDWRALPATSADWLTNPETHFQYPGGGQWWTVPHLDLGAGDIKDVWEPARFAWVYDLVRAALVTDDPRYAHAFRELYTQWRISSPPFQGPHWSCGQETGIRAIALLYAEANLPHTDGVAETLAASGERIADAYRYAISQRNNHAISEVTALLALGARFENIHAEAAEWRRIGRQWLVRLIDEQFASDGWYVQHSFSYMRLALDQCIVAERVLRARDEALPAACAARLVRATQLLFAVMDPTTGQVPNHGSVDGAFVHPITLAGYRDFRPVVTAACATWGQSYPVNVRLCAETLAWLGIDAPLSGPPLGDGVWSGPSGWAAARVGSAHVFLRAGEYSSRPGHLDPLQLDVRFGATEMLVDAGTYKYNAPPPWRNALMGARTHNGPVLDGAEPGIRGRRFLWYRWPAARMLRAELVDEGAVLVAEVSGRMRRTVEVRRSEVVITDVIDPNVARTVTVRWLLHPGIDAALVDVHDGAMLRMASEVSPIGWYSPAYGVRIPSAVLEAEREAEQGATVITHVHAPRIPT